MFFLLSFLLFILLFFLLFVLLLFVLFFLLFQLLLLHRINLYWFCFVFGLRLQLFLLWINLRLWLCSISHILIFCLYYVCFFKCYRLYFLNFLFLVFVFTLHWELPVFQISFFVTLILAWFRFDYSPLDFLFSLLIFSILYWRLLSFKGSCLDRLINFFDIFFSNFYVWFVGMKVSTPNGSDSFWGEGLPCLISYF